MPDRTARSGAEPPEIGIEITPALERAFYDWWAENSHAMANGLCGDVQTLFSAFLEASKKEVILSCDIPIATSKSSPA